MGIFSRPGFTISVFKSIFIKLICSFSSRFYSILESMAPNRNSGKPVLEFTISFTSCRKLQNGLSRTIRFTYLGYLEEKRTAVTAPIDRPHRFTLSTLNFYRRYLTTLNKSFDSFIPIVIYSPSLTPDPE